MEGLAETPRQFSRMLFAVANRDKWRKISEDLRESLRLLMSAAIMVGWPQESIGNRPIIPEESR